MESKYIIHKGIQNVERDGRGRFVDLTLNVRTLSTRIWKGGFDNWKDVSRERK